LVISLATFFTFSDFSNKRIIVPSCQHPQIDSDPSFSELLLQR
jgi:hypothetical protein